MDTQDVEMIRVLVDNISGKVIELDDFVGEPDDDWQLQDAVMRLQKYNPAEGVKIGGNDITEAAQGDRFLCRVERHHWNNADTRKQILSQIGKGHTGFAEDFYDVRNFLQEDALSCYAKHNRPKGGCIDWHDKSKEVASQLLTPEERDYALREGISLSQRKSRFLCDWCPVTSGYVDPKRRQQAGLDK